MVEVVNGGKFGATRRLPAETEIKQHPIGWLCKLSLTISTSLSLPLPHVFRTLIAHVAFREGVLITSRRGIQCRTLADLVSSRACIPES
jgi:hypothetical protein